MQNSKQNGTPMTQTGICIVTAPIQYQLKVEKMAPPSVRLRICPKA